MYNPRGLHAKQNLVNNLGDCLNWRRLDVAPEIHTKGSLTVKHQQAKLKKFASETNELLTKRNAFVKRLNDGSKSVDRFQPNGLKYNELLLQEGNNKSGTQPSNSQQLKAKSPSKPAVPELKIDAGNPQPADLATLWHFMQEAKMSAPGSNIYNLSNHYHGGTYNYSPAFNPNTIGNSKLNNPFVNDLFVNYCRLV